MHPFEDYYEILQVHFRAEPEVIEAAYKKLAQKYHPDVNKSSIAAERMKKINTAHDILRDPAKRRDYDDKWLQKRGDTPDTNATPPHAQRAPALAVLPKHIRFKDLGYRDIKTTYFDIKNTGGSHINYTIAEDRLPPWLEITEIQTLTGDLLPARVHIRVTGQPLGTKCDCYIPIQTQDQETMHSEEIKVHVELVMKGPVLQIDRTFIEFTVFTDVIPLPQTITLKNLGIGYIEGNLVPRQKWIKISPRAVEFNDKRDVQVQIDTAQLFTDIVGYVDVRTNCGDDVITVKASLSHEEVKTKKKR